MFIRPGFEGLNFSGELQMVLSAQPEYKEEMDTLFFTYFFF